jgi:hypothetical protein
MVTQWPQLGQEHTGKSLFSEFSESPEMHPLKEIIGPKFNEDLKVR